LQCELQFLGSFRPERFAAAALRAYLESWDPHLSVVKNGIEQLTFTFGLRTITPFRTPKLIYMETNYRLNDLAEIDWTQRHE